MCGRFGRQKTFWEYLKELDEAGLRLVRPLPNAAPNLEPNANVRPTTQVPIFRPIDGGLEMVEVRWWLIPWWHKGTVKDFKLTTFNARAETVATARAFKGPFEKRRCLIPADGWYEWTGPKGEKQKWYFTPRDGKPICFAGLWDRCKTTDAGEVESCTIVTQPAGAELNACHDRAPVVLSQADWKTWLEPTADVGPLMGAESAARFNIEKA